MNLLSCGENRPWTCTSGCGSSTWQTRKRSWRGRKNSEWRKQGRMCTSEFTFWKQITSNRNTRLWTQSFGFDSRPAEKFPFLSPRETCSGVHLGCGSSWCRTRNAEPWSGIHLLLLLFQPSVESIYCRADRHCNSLLSNCICIRGLKLPHISGADSRLLGYENV